jgi:hypothetical protein
VTIGWETRLYSAFITTAPATLDAPSTLTLYQGPLKDVAGFAIDPMTFEAARATTLSRLVLIDTSERGWQRARCQSRAHRLMPVRPSCSTSTPCSSGCGNDSGSQRVCRRTREEPHRERHRALARGESQ